MSLAVEEPRSAPAEVPPVTRVRLAPARALALPFACSAVLLAFCLLPAVNANGRLQWTFAGAAAALSAWSTLLLVAASRARRLFTVEIALRRQHYVQACAHTAILLYWGWHWRQVYDSAHLIAAQIVFAYAFDSLLAWSRDGSYTLGFGAFPIVFSTNLFLWFKEDWFYFQFLIIAVGFAAKAFVRWQKDGRSAHIFNPSALTLTLASVGLLLTGSSDLTWGREIAVTQFYPPHMYVFLFLVALPGQLLFGVASMTLAAVATTYAIGLAYFAATGTYFFLDSYVPIAVFLGMHLLFTDPSTSPRTELGRLIFGALYGASVVVLYALLARAGMPTFYDKLLQVPLLNLSIKAIDRLARTRPLQRLRPESIGPHLTGVRRNLAYVSLWAMLFLAMSVSGGVGDRHPGQWLPFWQSACARDRAGACAYLVELETTLCRAGSGWACNELGNVRVASVDGVAALAAWQRGCELGFGPACANAGGGVDGAAATGPPTLADYPILLRGSKGPVTDLAPAALYARACEQGWADACRITNHRDTEAQR